MIDQVGIQGDVVDSYVDENGVTVITKFDLKSVSFINSAVSLHRSDNNYIHLNYEHGESNKV